MRIIKGFIKLIVFTIGFIMMGIACVISGVTYIVGTLVKELGDIGYRAWSFGMNSEDPEEETDPKMESTEENEP